MPYSSKRRSKERISWPDLWFKDKALKHVVFKMQLDSLKSPRSRSPKNQVADNSTKLEDLTALLTDEILLRILSSVSDLNSNSLVCRRWLRLTGCLRSSIRVHDWEFLESGRLTSRFPCLVDVDIVPACIESRKNSSILLSHSLLSLHLNADYSGGTFIPEEGLMMPETIDEGLTILSRGCPNLRRLALIAATERGLSSIAACCQTLQELELHCCNEMSLRSLGAFQHLQILRVIGCIEGFYESVISDIGLTFLAHGCAKLVKLELGGCEGSYDGIRAIGKCCSMLEELTIWDHRMDEGWVAALHFCGNLKNLKVRSCKIIDEDPGAIEYLLPCPTLEKLQLHKCQLRNKKSLAALFFMCQTIKELELHECWGLDDEMFATAAVCRQVKFLSLEGCSMVSTGGLEFVVLSWNELQRLRLVSCKNVKDDKVTPTLAGLFSTFKEFKWQPDSRSLLESTLPIGLSSKGGKRFR